MNLNSIHNQHQLLLTKKTYEENTGRRTKEEVIKGSKYTEYLEQADVFFTFLEGVFGLQKNRPGTFSDGILTVKWEFVKGLIDGNLKVAIADINHHIIDSNFEPKHWRE